MAIVGSVAGWSAARVAGGMVGGPPMKMIGGVALCSAVETSWMMMRRNLACLCCQRDAILQRMFILFYFFNVSMMED